MWWHLRQDFASLFNRIDDSKEHFYSIDGLRAIANLLIISCHSVTIFSAFIPSYPSVEWQQYLRSGAFALSPLMAYALEIFFMLSGFLLTHKLLTQWNQNNASHHLFLQQYPIFILKRALRFWPGMVLSMALMLIYGEPRYPNSGYLFELLRYLSVWMFFQNYTDTKYWLPSLAPLWSISLDMQVHIILPLLLYLFYSCRNYISVYHSLRILFVLSIVLSIVIFNPATMPIVLITLRYHILPLLLPVHVLHWIEINYNLKFPFKSSQSNPMKLFLQKMYLPLEARFGSFIAGAMLATQIVNNSRYDGKNSTLKKYVFLGLIFLYIISPMVQNVDAPPLQSDFLITLFIASSRQIFALGQAFILFTALCPSSHSYHSPWIKRFLSLPIWIPISKLSYLVYLIHWRISFEFIFGGQLASLKAYSVTYAVFISLPVVLFASQLISSIWYVLIEKPIERVVDQHLNRRCQSSKIHLQ
jgi:peptidoglycan/LPS O-acetylase OafA/YrhL